MRKLVLAATLAASVMVGSAAAQQEPEEHWEVVGLKGGAMGWEVNSITGDDDEEIYTVTRLMYFANGMPFTNGGGSFSFVMQEITLDCVLGGYQLGDSVMMDADGEIIGNGNPDGAWLDIDPDTLESLLEAAVCYFEPIDNIYTYDSSEAAMAGAKFIAIR